MPRGGFRATHLTDPLESLTRDGQPKKKVGRPSNASKPLGKTDLKHMSKMLGEVSVETINYIISVMRNEQNKPETRLRAASWIIDQNVKIVREIDRQELMESQMKLLNAKSELSEISIEQRLKGDSPDDDSGGATIFQLHCASEITDIDED